MRSRLPLLAALVALPLAAPLHAQTEPARPPERPLPASVPGIPSYEHHQEWLSRDKFYHFGISAVGTSGLYAGGRRLGFSRRQAALASTLLMGAAGVWREVGTTDLDNPVTRGHISRKDLVWDVAGIALGLAVTDRWLARSRAGGDLAPAGAVPPPPPPGAGATTTP